MKFFYLLLATCQQNTLLGQTILIVQLGESHPWMFCYSSNLTLCHSQKNCKVWHFVCIIVLLLATHFNQTQIWQGLQVAVERSVLEAVLKHTGLFWRPTSLFWVMHYWLLLRFLIASKWFHRTGNLLLFHSAVLEPDFDLAFWKTQSFGQSNSAWSANVPRKIKIHQFL